MRFGCLLIGAISIWSFSSAVTANEPIDLSDVGVVSLENSGAPDAQQAFLHGLAQLHNFEYGYAAEDFREAQRIDPNFALAYWGEALSYNHAIWMEQDKEAALSALARYAPTPVGRRTKAPTALARDLMGAVDILYGAGAKEDQDDLYMAEMARLLAKYPENVEIASLYALSILGTAHAGREFSLYMQSAAVLEDFIGAYPGHPGVAHYLIHSTDDPIHAPLGLRAARAFGDIAPNAAHPQHMTSHIFLALGMWDDVIGANVRAIGLVNAARAKVGKPTMACGHYPAWLLYAYLQQGRRDEAFAIMNRCHEIVTNEGRDSESTLAYYAWMRPLYLFDTGEWRGQVAAMRADFEASPAAGFEDQYLAGLVALNTGDIAAAIEAQAKAGLLLDRLNAHWDAAGVPADRPLRFEPVIELMQLEAQIALAQGKPDAALSLLRQATAVEAKLPFGFGPPDPAKPSLELLGETLLGLGRIEEAHTALSTALSRTRGKALTVAALAAAEAALELN